MLSVMKNNGYSYLFWAEKKNILPTLLSIIQKKSDTILCMYFHQYKLLRGLWQGCELHQCILLYTTTFTFFSVKKKLFWPVKELQWTAYLPTHYWMLKIVVQKTIKQKLMGRRRGLEGYGV